MAYIQGQIHSFILYALLLTSTLCLSSEKVYASQWYKLDQFTTFITPKPGAQFILPNISLIEGNQCSALIDSHGDFVALEQLVNKLKDRLKTPLCYLISTTSHPEGLVGMSVLQHAFPSAKLFSPKQFHQDQIEKYLSSKLVDYETSLRLSLSRLESLGSSEKTKVEARFKQAEKRVKRWQKLKPARVHKEVISSTKISLGNVSIELSAISGASLNDLAAFLPFNQGLIMGHSADKSPYLSHQHWKKWQKALIVIHQTDPKWVLPGFGKPYKGSSLRQPIGFFDALNQERPNQTLPDKLYSKDEQQRANYLFEHAKKFINMEK